MGSTGLPTKKREFKFINFILIDPPFTECIMSLSQRTPVDFYLQR